MMQTTDSIWINGNFIPWEDARVHVLTHTLHYGGGAFEGIRAYDTGKGTAIFRLQEHMERLLYSSKALKMQVPYDVDSLGAATVELVRRNKLKQGYIRPLVYFGYGVMGLNPRNAPVDVAISCWPWGAYLPHEAVDLKISSFIRIHNRSTIADAKLCGHYVNSILAVLELHDTEFHEALLLNSEGFIAEGPGENLFLVKDGTLTTPKAGSILPGITRDTIMQIARSFEMPVQEKELLPEDAFTADEAFFTGTAAEVTPVRSIDRRVIGNGCVGPFTAKLRSAYMDAVYGRSSAFAHFLTYVD